MYRPGHLRRKQIAGYANQQIDILDAARTKEAWPLVCSYVLNVVMAVSLYIAGMIANRLW